MIMMTNEAYWTHEAIAEIEMALGVEGRIGVALSDEDLSHVPTFGALVEPMAERA